MQESFGLHVGVRIFTSFYVQKCIDSIRCNRLDRPPVVLLHLLYSMLFDVAFRLRYAPTFYHQIHS